MSFIKRKFCYLILPAMLMAFTIPALSAQSQAGSANPSAQTTSPTGAAQTAPSTQPSTQAPSTTTAPSSPATQPSTQQPSTSPSSPASPQQSTTSNSQPSGQQQTASATSGTVIPAGTLITITPTQPIQNAQVGSTYPAQISQNVTGTNGSVLIPAGSQAQLTVNNAVSPSGTSEMALALKSVTVNGQTYNVSTSEGQQSSAPPQTGASTQSQNNASQQSNAPSTGGLLGTLVQAIGGNQQGSSANQQASTNQQPNNSNQQASTSNQGTSGSGGLGSILGQILTHGATMSVPSQSQLTFRLDQPLQLH
jgi:hypothetical protein